MCAKLGSVGLRSLLRTSLPAEISVVNPTNFKIGRVWSLGLIKVRFQFIVWNMPGITKNCHNFEISDHLHATEVSFYLGLMELPCITH